MSETNNKHTINIPVTLSGVFDIEIPVEFSLKFKDPEVAQLPQAQEWLNKIAKAVSEATCVPRVFL